MVHHHNVKVTKTLSIDGMTCHNCVRHVTRALGAVQGLEVREVRLGAARVEFDPQEVSESRVTEAVAEAGYPARITS